MDDLDAAASGGLVLPALESKFELAFRLAWAHEALAAAARAIEMTDRPARLHLAAARLLTGARCDAAALMHIEAALGDPAHTNDARLVIAAAGLYASLDREADARRAIDRGAALAEGSLPVHREAARLLLEIGDIDAAEAHLTSALEISPRGAPVLAALGSLRLWAADCEAARDLSERAIEADHACAEGYRLRGAARAFTGEHALATADLDAAVKLDPSEGEALLWRGEIKLKQGAFDAGFTDIDRAVTALGGDVFAARLVRLLGSIDAGQQPSRLSHSIIEDVIDGVLELFPDERGAFESGDPTRVRALLARSLDALSGNRSVTPTYLREGPEGRSLVRLRVRPHPRHAARRALELIRASDPDVALRALDAVTDRYPISAIPLCHRGELLLWLGRYAEARRDFERAIAIERSTRWGYIGLGAGELLEGDPARALGTFERGVEAMGGTTGVSLFVYRGEAYRELGRLDEATRDLERACAETPSRVGAWINLALACDSAGNGARRGAIVARLMEQAPALLSDAAADASVPLIDGDAGDPDGERVILKRALTLLRGNRSSTCITYFTARGALRIIPKFPHAGASPHDRDAADLARVRKWLSA
jgi:tetratricopeptide (TPR) repeat protein